MDQGHEQTVSQRNTCIHIDRWGKYFNLTDNQRNLH